MPSERRSIDRVVSVWAEQTPRATAIIAGDGILRYAELERRSDELAGRLRQAGVYPDAGVGLLLPRSAGFAVAALSVLKTGAYYVPLSVELPTDRLRTMIADNNIRLILTDGSRLAIPEPIEYLDIRIERPSAAPTPEHPRFATPHSTAYVVYTSGTTGRPKGVAVTHGGVLGLADGNVPLDPTPNDRILLHSSLLFDASVFELWFALLRGATVVVTAQDKPSILHYVQTIDQHQVTTAFFTTALFNRLVRHRITTLGRLRNLLFGGETCAPELVHQAAELWPNTRLIHCYGPTECAVFTTCHPISGTPERPIPIGKALAGRYFRVLSDNLQPVPPESPGELWIGGNGLAIGYIARRADTATTFVPDPCHTRAGARLYRTGDLVVQRRTGELVFLERRDAQLKIRGYRIEPAEVEQALRQHPHIEDAVVLADSDRLIAFIIQHPSHRRSDTDLRTFLAENLPAFMIPSVFSTIERIPLNSSGKVDRSALTEMLRDNETRVGRGSTTTNDLDGLTELWRRVLGVPNLTADDDFFLIGGHSLQILEILQTLSRTWGVELAIEEFLDKPTPTALYAKITSARKKAAGHDSSPTP